MRTLTFDLQIKGRIIEVNGCRTNPSMYSMRPAFHENGEIGRMGALPARGFAEGHACRDLGETLCNRQAQGCMVLSVKHLQMSSRAENGIALIFCIPLKFQPNLADQRRQQTNQYHP
jgi:hypothetical protein